MARAVPAFILGMALTATSITGAVVAAAAPGDDVANRGGGSPASAGVTTAGQVRCQLDSAGDLPAMQKLTAAVERADEPSRSPEERRSRRADVGGATYELASAIRHLGSVITQEPMTDECNPRRARAATAAELAAVQAAESAWTRWERRRLRRDAGEAKRLAALRLAVTNLGAYCVAVASSQP